MRLGHRARASRRSRASPRCRWAAPRRAPASTLPPGFPQKVIAMLAERPGLPITEARDHFEAQGARDGLVEASGALRVIAVSLTKICNDLRWMGSGPNTGLGELHIPDLQPGSSIMPGKVNPVIPEAVLMVVRPRDRQRRDHRLGRRLRQLRAQRRDPGDGHGAARVDPAARQLARSPSPTRPSTGSRRTSSAPARWPSRRPSIVTPLNKVIGYETAAKIAKHSVARAMTVREAVDRPRFRRARRGHRSSSSTRPSTSCR